MLVGSCLTMAAFAAEMLIGGWVCNEGKIKLGCDDDGTICDVTATAQNSRLEVDTELYATEFRTNDVSLSELAAQLEAAQRNLTMLQAKITTLQGQVATKMAERAVDTSPTDSTDNLITSKGVKDALALKQDKIGATIRVNVPHMSVTAA